MKRVKSWWSACRYFIFRKARSYKILKNASFTSKEVKSRWLLQPAWARKSKIQKIARSDSRTWIQGGLSIFLPISSFGHETVFHQTYLFISCHEISRPFNWDFFFLNGYFVPRTFFSLSFFCFYAMRIPLLSLPGHQEQRLRFFNSRACFLFPRLLRCSWGLLNR